MIRNERYLTERKDRHCVDAIGREEIIGLFPIVVIIVDVRVGHDNLLSTGHPPARM